MHRNQLLGSVLLGLVFLGFLLYRYWLLATQH